VSRRRARTGFGSVIWPRGETIRAVAFEVRAGIG
jgi:hypothetical protein